MSLSLAVAPFEWKAQTRRATTRTRSTSSTPPATPTSPARSMPRSPSPTSRSSWSARSTASRSAPRSAWRRCDAPASRAWCSSTRRTSSAPTSTPCSTQLRSTVRQRLRAARAAARRGGDAARRRRRADATRASSTSPTDTHHTEPIPADVADEEHRLHDELVEEIVSGDDEQLERYLSGEVPTPDRAGAHAGPRGAATALEFPVLLGSALTGVGDRPARRLHLRARPVARRPAGHASSAATEQVAVAAPTPSGTAAGLRVQDRRRPVRRPGVAVQGPVGHDRTATIASSTRTTGTEERLHGLFHLRGKEHVAVNRVVAGDIAAVAKLSSTPDRHSTLAAEGLARAGRAAADGAGRRTAWRSKPVTQSDDDKLSGALHRLCSEDPTLSVVRPRGDPPDRARGAGDTHLAVALERLARKFGVNVDDRASRRCRTARRSSAAAEAEGKVKKQTGGHGQYAVANLRVAPTERGAGSEFVDSIVGGAIPRNYIPAVQKGIEETMTTGGAYGFPVVDVTRRVLRRQVPLRRLVRHGVPHRGVARLEGGAWPRRRRSCSSRSRCSRSPCPRATRATCSATSTRAAGRVSGSNPLGDGLQEITAMVPAAEIQRYAVDLRSMTGGRGTFVAVHDHYDVLPDPPRQQARRRPGEGQDASVIAATPRVGFRPRRGGRQPPQVDAVQPKVGRPRERGGTTTEVMTDSPRPRTPAVPQNQPPPPHPPQRRLSPPPAPSTP